MVEKRIAPEMSGNVITKNRRILPAPSNAAASYILAGIIEKAAKKTRVIKPAFFQMYIAMSTMRGSSNGILENTPETAELGKSIGNISAAHSAGF